MENTKKQEETEVLQNYDEKSEKYSIWKWIFCYGLAFLLVSVILYGLTGAITGISNAVAKRWDWWNLESTSFGIISTVSIIYFLYRLTRNLGEHWRSSDKNEIGTAVTNFPNPFYDPNFKKGPLALQKKYRELYTAFQVTKSLLKKSNEYVAELDGLNKQYESKLRVLLRHHDNANRLIHSLNYFIKIKDTEFVQKMLRFILNECITILEQDLSDKSISLFKVNSDVLEITESVRINAESIAKRRFKKGEWFAGEVWKAGKPLIENQVNTKVERFGSILGFPLKVDDETLGVLCLQSETENGFRKEDLRSVEFYSQLCTMLLLYDKMEREK